MNYEVVKSLIKNNFSLGNGYDDFERLLEKNVKEFSFLDENKRKIYPISKEVYPFIDDGYNLLLNLDSFIKKYNIDFNAYSEGKVKVGANEIKLFKAAVHHYSSEIKKNMIVVGTSDSRLDYGFTERVISAANGCSIELYSLIRKLYKPSEIRDIAMKIDEVGRGVDTVVTTLVTKVFEKIGSYKINTSKDLFFVVSKNFNDFFLCSNGESWTSCLNPESASGFWSSIPFLIGDPNRCLCFISDLSEKEYLGVKSLKMLKRSWGLLDRQGKINTGIYYPAKEYINEGFYNNLKIDETFQNLKNSFMSKYSLDLFYNKYKTFDFLYQDDTYFDFYDSYEEVKLCRGTKNHTIIVKENGTRDYHMTSFKEGLKSLIEMDKELYDFPGLHFCKDCGDLVDENGKISYTLVDGTKKKACSKCFKKDLSLRLVICSVCGEVIENSQYHSEHIKDDERSIVCSHCYRCASCGRVISEKKDEVREYKVYKLCVSCASDRRQIEKKNPFEEAMYSSDSPFEKISISIPDGLRRAMREVQKMEIKAISEDVVQNTEEEV